MYHGRFSLEPDEIRVVCRGNPYYVIPGEIMDHMRTVRCGEGYPDGFEPYTDAFAGLDVVRAFLAEYPLARPGFTHEHVPGFVSEDGGRKVELSIYHEPGVAEPGRAVVTCWPPEGGLQPRESRAVEGAEPGPFCP